MPRACVIVLDAVGAGALPDAGEYGDEGSNTLGNVAAAVGGLDLPNLEALEGQGYDNGTLGVDGHCHRDAVPDVPARLSA
jgi:phosphopentomutase